MRKLAFFLALLLLSGSAFVARCWNLRDVLIDGRIYFVDADCYSRMTRARMVSEGAAVFISHHTFENHPDGVTPHTTAPMDFLIVGTERVVSASLGLGGSVVRAALQNQSLDIAGALIGPILGSLAVLAAGLFAVGMRPLSYSFALAGAAVVAFSPIVVHGTVLGRPDHQALLVLLMVCSLGAELRLLQEESRLLAILAGVGWGLGLWVSLYEPLILLVLTLVGLVIVQRDAFSSRLRWLQWAITLAIFALAVMLDGWRLSWPDAAAREQFARWSPSIFELRSMDLRSGVLWQWLGGACVLVPVALLWPGKRTPESLFAAVVLLGTAALTFAQLRWGYFLAVVFALSLPLAMRVVSRPWIAWAICFAGLWPVASAWEAQIYPNESLERRRLVARREQVALRWIGERQRERNAGPFIAPWWLSPPLAYWSRQPGVAGSSHQSLPGIEDTARVYLARDAGEAWPILQKRGVKWLVADAPERVVPTSAALFGQNPPEHSLAHDLLTAALPAPYTLAMIPERDLRNPTGEDFFRVWRVRTASEPANIDRQ